MEPELALAAACCAWPFSDTTREYVRSHADRVSQWDRFGHLVAVHRIAPLVHRALADAAVEVPLPLAETLRDRAKRAASYDLRLAGETIRLQCAFQKAGIAMVVLKGVVVEMLAYGQLGMKMSCDIDLLVDSNEHEEVRGVLATLGYRAVYDEKQCAAIGDLAHEMSFLHANGIEIDVHTRLCSNPKMLSGIDATGPTQAVALAGGTVTALADGPLFAFLCFHGAKHQWSRLKWLADLNAFASARRDKLGELLDEAGRYGVGRSASNALRLSTDLFGTQWPETIGDRLDSSWIARALRADTVAAPTFRGRSATPSTRSWLLQFGLEKGSGHAASHFRTRWYSTVDRAALRLPRRWEFLYHLLRIPLGIWRSLGRTKHTAPRAVLGRDA